VSGWRSHLAVYITPSTLSLSLSLSLSLCSFDFWTACVKKAVEMGPGKEGEKCQLFYHLFSFLRDFEPEVINTGLGRGVGAPVDGDKKRRGSWKDKERQKGLRVISNLAKKAEAFPPDIFENKAVIAALKNMFGFV
jgi:hypothetical protein